MKRGITVRCVRRLSSKLWLPCRTGQSRSFHCPQSEQVWQDLHPMPLMMMKMMICHQQMMTRIMMNLERAAWATFSVRQGTLRLVLVIQVVQVLLRVDL